MILFRSYKNRILLASLAFALFGAIQASFILPASTISKENVDVNVNLVNGVAIRILDSAATAEITELDLSATAAPTGTFVADDFKVEVSTANKTGYKLYMSSSYQDTSTSTYTTDLVNQTNTSYTISTVPVATTKTDLRTATPGSTNANKWAYSLDDTTYNPVPVNSAPTQIDSYDDPTTGNQTPVYIGMNVNVEKPSGVYKNQLTFSAVGNPVPTAYSLYFEPGTTDPVAGLPDPNPMTASAVATSYTFTIPSTVPTRAGYSFTGYLDESTSTTYQPGGTITVLGDIDYTGSATLVAQWTIVSSTLTVDPNGGTWSGSTSTQTFPGDYGSTKVIGTPSANATYTISYNDNSQSATYSPNPPAPTSVSRPFTGWTLTATGGGSPSGSFDTTTNTYTYNIASDALTAGYNTTSNTITLPTITKTGHTCTWHENSASGTSHTSGETNVTISANTEFFAVCTANPHNVTVTAGTGIASTTGSGSHDYGTNVAIGATLSAGYHFADPKWTVNSGGVTISNDSFTMPDNDVSVTANGAINTCPITYNSNAPSGTTASGSMSDSSMTYNQAVTLTSNAFSITGYTFLGWAESASGSVVFANGATLTAAQTASYCGTHNTTKNLYAKWDNHYTLTVNPNGGTWSQSGFVNNQRTGTYNESIIISNPTAGPSYTISYDGNGQGASYTGSPTSVTRPFSSWSLSGSGTWVGSTNTFTYGAGAATLTASYSNTSNSFTLPAISKTGHSCKWAEGSASGTQYTGGTSRTITGNTTYYAVCTANNYTVNISNNNTTSGASSLSVPYGGSKTVTVTPNSGYYLTAVSCPSGYSCTGYSVSGYDTTGTQTVTVTNNSTTSGGTVTFTATSRPTLSQACNSTATQGTFTYGGTLYVKLKTNAGGTTTACYTRNYVAQVPYSEAASKCPSGTGIPTKTDYDALITAYGSGGDLWAASGFSDGGFHWSSTEYRTGRMYFLVLWSTGAVVGNTSPGDVANSNLVTCIVR